jgi:ATP-dependent DNA helicase RecQ
LRTLNAKAARSEKRVRNPARVRKIARERLGYTQLWPGQEEAMVAVLEGRDTLVAMPAGCGKSVAWRVPALMLPGPTVVVSPFAAVPNDSADAISDELTFLFLGIGQLDEAAVERIRSARPSLFVVDQAQRICAGTEEFLPGYLALSTVIASVGRPLVVALTAAANPAVRMEIISRLGMRNTAVVVRGFDPPSAFLEQAG